ncbi:MAG: hypothetical protein ACRD4G_11965, partial [Bryobacteraceae bacterium]
MIVTTRAMRLILLAFLLLPAASAAPQQPPVTIQAALQYEGLPVVSISWQPAHQPLTPAQLASKLPFHP